MAASSLHPESRRPNLAPSNATNVSGPGTNLFGVYDSPTMLPRTPLAPGKSREKNIMTTVHDYSHKGLLLLTTDCILESQMR